jgi:hypothetical protein
MSPDHGKPGNGLLLFFRVDDLDMALPRARALVTRLEEEPRMNPNTGTMDLAPRSGRVLRHDQRALCGLTIHSSRRRFAARLNSGVSCTSQSMEIRPEKPNDAPTVRRVNEAAFGQPDEADLVDRLRDRAVSYLALFSPVTMAPPQPTLSALGLAPMALGTCQASDSHVSRTV